MRAKKITSMAMLTAAALIIFIVELQIPSPVSIPGVKPGLANIVTVYAMFAMDPISALMILLCRVALGCMLSGQAMSFIYSIAGGFLAYLSMLFMRRLVTEKQIWVCSAVAAVFHNIGQIIAAVFITGTASVAAYLPVLIISGVITGVFTGLSAQFVVKRIGKKF